MELYIQIRDGQPYQHPILGDNFREAFPHIDVNNLPSEFAKFIRHEPQRNASVFEVDEVKYEWVNGVVQDVWSVRPMTDDERAVKIEEIRKDILDRCAYFKKIANISLDYAIENNEIEMQNALTEYLGRLNAWVLVDPLNHQLPSPPVFNQDGTVKSLDVAGSAPNVIY